MKTNIKQILFVGIVLQLAGCMLSMSAQNSGGTYIAKRTFLQPSDQNIPENVWPARREVSFYDGLGRPLQVVKENASGNGSLSIADLIEYDGKGRTFRSWRPVSATWDDTSNPVSVDTVKLRASTFYAPSGVSTDTCAYNLMQYDDSPLDRIRKETGPGAAWHNAGKGVTKGYLTNAGSQGADSLQCVKYAFSLSGNTGISFGRDGFWPAGSLAVERTEDEDGRTLWVFKDMRDLTVLERRLAEGASGGNPAVYADTYYLHDDAGRLVAVLPPELSKYFGQGSWSGSTGGDPKVAGFAFQYRYDSRGRMIAKKLPGADWTYCIYDGGDRLVLTQDGNQRIRNEWLFQLQDALGRECLTGTLEGNYNAFSDPLAFEQVLAVRDRSSGTYGDLHGYTVSGMTLPSNAEVLTVSWWDDYSFLGREPGMTGTEYGYTAPASGSGYDERYGTDAPTGRWSRALGDLPSGWSQTAVRETWYYDDRGRTVRHVKGYPSGSRITEQSGYSFTGELTALGRTISLSNSTSRTERYTYTYDDWGRPLATTHQLDGGTNVLLSSNTYDAVGRLSLTQRGGTSVQDSPAALASSYTYNVRDWLTGIAGDLFTETLTYETPRTGSQHSGQWGGNISSSLWRSGVPTGPSCWYDYGYDLLNRLTAAAYGSGYSGQDDYSRSYAYDLNGNLEGRDDALCSEQWTSVSGNAPALWSRTALPPSIVTLLEEGYAYDAAGNRTAVLDAQGDTLNVMRYNLLNLPEEYTTAAGDTVKYVYSADGEKLYVQLTTAANVTTGTEYAANYRLENGTITMIHTDAGYYTPSMMYSPGGGGQSWQHLWYLQDHLGNNRVLADGGGNPVVLHDYDPYGEEVSALTSGMLSTLLPGMTISPYKYGGKEWTSTTSTYDFEARQMAPAFHRFTTMDPLAEKYYSISPYAYCAGNPVNLMDKDGRKLYFAKGSSAEFKKRFAEAVKIMNAKGLSYNIAKLHESISTYYIAETELISRVEPSESNKSATVFWDPNTILTFENGILVSPVTVLAHEMSHAAGYDESPVDYSERKGQKDKDYDNKEEKRVIEGDEQIAARKLGEITPDMVTRNSHDALDLFISFTYSTPLIDIILHVSSNNRQN